MIYKGELFEHFRYRFALPESEVDGRRRIPIVFQRFLRPGNYSLVLKIENTAGKRFFREQRELEVPFTPVAPAAPAVAESAAPAPQSGPRRSQSRPRPTPAPCVSDGETIRILTPPPGLLTGKVRVEAAVPEPATGIANVTLRADGKPVLTKAKPPFSVELNLGDAAPHPPPQALALDAARQDRRRGRGPAQRRPPPLRRAAGRAAAGQDLQVEPARPGPGRGPRGGRARPGGALPQRRPRGDPLPAALRPADPPAPEQGDHLRPRRRLSGGRQLDRGPGAGQRAGIQRAGRRPVRRALHHGGGRQGPAGRGARPGRLHRARGRRSSSRSAASSGCATCRSTPASCSTPRPRWAKGRAEARGSRARRPALLREGHHPQGPGGGDHLRDQPNLAVRFTNQRGRAGRRPGRPHRRAATRRSTTA